MKRLLIAIFFLAPLLSFSQEKERDVYDTLSEKICDYLNKHTEVKVTTQKEAEEFFSNAFLEVAMPMLERLMEIEGVESFDYEAGQVIGKKVGIKLAATCPKYLEIMRPVVKEVNSAETGNIKGTVTEVAQDTYTYLKIKTADGTFKRVVWLTSFDESESLNNDPQKLVGKKVEIKWTATQLFHYKSKTYAAEKVINGIKIN